MEKEEEERRGNRQRDGSERRRRRSPVVSHPATPREREATRHHFTADGENNTHGVDGEGVGCGGGRRRGRKSAVPV